MRSDFFSNLLDELSAVLRALLHSGRAVGLEVTVFNPALDPDGAIARQLVKTIASGFTVGRYE